MSCENCCAEKPVTRMWSEFKIAVPIALGLAILFVFLQKNFGKPEFFCGIARCIFQD